MLCDTQYDEKKSTNDGNDGWNDHCDGNGGNDEKNYIKTYTYYDFWVKMDLY